MTTRRTSSRTRRIRWAATLMATLAAATAWVSGTPAASAATETSWAFVWADQPTAASYTPAPAYQGNVTGGVNTITRSGVGRYEVRFSGIAAFEGETQVIRYGNLQVTAYGGGTTRCVAGFYQKSGPDMSAPVYCTDAAGAPADSPFTAMYVRDTRVDPGRQFATASVLPVNYPNINDPTPMVLRSANSTGAGLNTVQRLSTGRYAVSFPGFTAGGGHVQVTASLFAGAFCSVEYWSTSTAYVVCFDAAGQLSNAPGFELLYVGNRSALPGPFRTAHLWANEPVATNWYVPVSPYSFNTNGTNQVVKASTGVFYAYLPGVQPSGVATNAVATAYGSATNHCRVGGWYQYGNDSLVEVRCHTAAGAPVDSRFTLLFNSLAGL